MQNQNEKKILVAWFRAYKLCKKYLTIFWQETLIKNYEILILLKIGFQTDFGQFFYVLKVNSGVMNNY